MKGIKRGRFIVYEENDSDNFKKPIVDTSIINEPISTCFSFPILEPIYITPKLFPHDICIKYRMK